MNNTLSAVKTTIQRLLLFIALLIGAVYVGFPVLWMLSSSFKSNTEIFAHPPLRRDVPIRVPTWLC